jgi:hypothetical protein
MAPKLVTRDGRSRIPLGSAARFEHYLVTPFEDGRILLTPAEPVALVDPGRLTAAQVLDRAAYTVEHPENLVRNRPLLRSDGSRTPAGTLPPEPRSTGRRRVARGE